MWVCEDGRGSREDEEGSNQQSNQEVGLGAMGMQRTTLVKAYLKWLDSRSGGKKEGKESQKK